MFLDPTNKKAGEDPWILLGRDMNDANDDEEEYFILLLPPTLTTEGMETVAAFVVPSVRE
jgi:hypothetical protein